MEGTGPPLNLCGCLHYVQGLKRTQVQEGGSRGCGSEKRGMEGIRPEKQECT